MRDAVAGGGGVSEVGTAASGNGATGGVTGRKTYGVMLKTRQALAVAAAVTKQACAAWVGWGLNHVAALLYREKAVRPADRVSEWSGMLSGVADPLEEEKRVRHTAIGQSVLRFTRKRGKTTLKFHMSVTFIPAYRYSASQAIGYVWLTRRIVVGANFN